MRGAMTVILVFLVCLVLLVLYIFLGRTQMVKTTATLKSQDEALQAQLDDIRLKEEAIPRLMARLPLWSRQLSMFREAIPNKIDDHVFFANLTKELAGRDVRILKLETTVGDSWLGQVTEEMEAELTELGVNVAAARNVRVAFYSATLIGDFKEVLTVFENLKKYNRLYTLDLVSGPATSGAGETTEIVDLSKTPLTFSGKLYYGVSDEEVSLETLAKVFGRAIAGPAARSIFHGVRDAAQQVPSPAAPAADKPAGDDKQASAPQTTRREMASARGRNHEEWLR